MARKKYILEYRDGRLFENGRWLPQKDYIYHANSSDGTNIISRVTGQLYRIRDAKEGVISYG